MKWYRVSYHCPTCSQDHGVSSERRIDGGPSEAGTVSELYPGGDLPEGLAQLMGDSVVCETSGEPVKMNDPARLGLWPWGAAVAGK